MIQRTQWSEVDSAVLPLAESVCRGTYQLALVRGVESLSGSTLRGKASRFADCYKQSAKSLVRRLRTAGLAVSERKVEHGARILVIRPDDRGAGI